MFFPQEDSTQTSSVGVLPNKTAYFLWESQLPRKKLSLSPFLVASWRIIKNYQTTLYQQYLLKILNL